MFWPTAQALLPTTLTPLNDPKSPAGTRVQAVPSQRAVRRPAKGGCELCPSPTAQSLVRLASMLVRDESGPASAGASTAAHAVPSQRRMKAWPPAVPTAQASVPLVKVSPKREDGAGI